MGFKSYSHKWKRYEQPEKLWMDGYDLQVRAEITKSCEMQITSCMWAHEWSNPFAISLIFFLSRKVNIGKWIIVLQWSSTETVRLQTLALVSCSTTSRCISTNNKTSVDGNEQTWRKMSSSGRRTDTSHRFSLGMLDQKEGTNTADKYGCCISHTGKCSILKLSVLSFPAKTTCIQWQCAKVHKHFYVNAVIIM